MQIQLANSNDPHGEATTAQTQMGPSQNTSTTPFRQAAVRKQKQRLREIAVAAGIDPELVAPKEKPGRKPEPNKAGRPPIDNPCRKILLQRQRRKQKREQERLQQQYNQQQRTMNFLSGLLSSDPAQEEREAHRRQQEIDRMNSERALIAEKRRVEEAKGRTLAEQARLESEQNSAKEMNELMAASRASEARRKSIAAKTPEKKAAVPLAAPAVIEQTPKKMVPISAKKSVSKRASRTVTKPKAAAVVAGDYDAMSRTELLQLSVDHVSNLEEKDAANLAVACGNEELFVQAKDPAFRGKKLKKRVLALLAYKMGLHEDFQDVEDYMQWKGCELADELHDCCEANYRNTRQE